ncbi:hypothetical protein ACFX2J_041044 [Malus domestica]
MATLKVSLSGTAAPTSSPSPSLKSWPHISDSPPEDFSGSQISKRHRINSSQAPSSGFSGEENESFSLCSYGNRWARSSSTSSYFYVGPTSNLRWKYKVGLEEKIQLVSIDLQDRPAWYKEKVYLANKVSFCD